jgi:peroxin-14
LPALQPPTESQLAEAQAALTAKYDEAAAILTGLQTETEAVKASLADQTVKVDTSLADLRQAVEELRAAETKRDELVNGCREEVEAIRDLLPRVRHGARARFWCNGE